MNNVEIARTLTRYADLLEIDGADTFRLRAYRFAADEIDMLGDNLSDLVADGRPLEEIPGIGKAIAAKIKVLVETGSLPQLQELEAKISEVYLRLLEVPGLGIKRVKVLYNKLPLEDMSQLQSAIENHEIQDLAGFGKKMEQTIAEAVASWV
jgi:DNA polymerase (family 10)